MAGVAIGAAAVIVIACIVLCFFCLQKKRRREATNANMASRVAAGNATPTASTVPTPGAVGKHPETSTTPVGTPHYHSNAPSTSPYSGAVNTVSPISLAYPPVHAGTTELAGNGWHPQQQADLNAPSQGARVHDAVIFPEDISKSLRRLFDLFSRMGWFPIPTPEVVCLTRPRAI